MRVLLTGSTGFVGKYLKEYLNRDNLITTIGRKNSHLEYHFNGDEIDLPDTDVVIYAAGYAHVSAHIKPLDFNFNHHGLSNFIKLFRSKKPRSFVYISTVAVYGKHEGILINEDSPLLAKDPYGLSKIQAEALVQEWCKKNGVICLILRLPLIAGPNPPGNLGTMIKTIKKGYYFNVGGGIARKSIVLAEDVAKFILSAAEVGGIYNLTDGYHPNFNELSQVIAKQSGKSNILNMPLVLAKIAAKIGDLGGKYAPLNTNKLNKITSTLTFDDSKARAAFGWNPTPVLEGFKIQ